jgi:hypothetical protein
MSEWKPARLPQPGDPEWVAEMADVLQAVIDGKVTACKPAPPHLPDWTYWWADDDVSGWVTELWRERLLDLSALKPTDDGEAWLAEVTG